MNNIADTSREISFAVFRVAKLIEQPKLKSTLESAAVDLVAECGTVPFVTCVPKNARLPYLPYIEKLIELIHLAEMVGEIKPVNSEVLQRELQSLYTMIAESIGKKEDINLSETFKKSVIASPEGAWQSHEIASDYRPRNDKIESQDDKSAVQDDRVKTDDETKRNNIIKTDEKTESSAINKEPQFKLPRTIKIPESSIIKTNQSNSLSSNERELVDAKYQIPEFETASTRQSAIVEFIKQLPNGCRMKDLMNRFNNISERTLRNDLQVLAVEDKIERFGAVQGPFSYFRIKSVVSSPALLD